MNKLNWIMGIINLSGFIISCYTIYVSSGNGHYGSTIVYILLGAYFAWRAMFWAKLIDDSSVV